MIKQILKPDEIMNIRPYFKGKIALIFGCFDLIHLGHLQLFRFAKKYANNLIISLANDKSIRLTKGNLRPIFSLNERCKFLTQIYGIDLVSPIKDVFNHNNEETIEICGRILSQIKPDYIVTIKSDPLLYLKTAKAKQFGIRSILLDADPKLSSSWIINKIKSI